MYEHHSLPTPLNLQYIAEVHHKSRPKKGKHFFSNCPEILVGTENGDLSFGVGLAKIYDFLTGLRRGHDEKIEKRGGKREEGGTGRLVKKMAAWGGDDMGTRAKRFHGVSNNTEAFSTYVQYIRFNRREIKSMCTFVKVSPFIYSERRAIPLSSSSATIGVLIASSPLPSLFPLPPLFSIFSSCPRRNPVKKS